MKAAPYEALGELIEAVEVDRDKLAGLILDEIDGKEHWVRTMERVLAKWKDNLIAELAERYRHLFIKNRKTG